MRNDAMRVLMAVLLVGMSLASGAEASDAIWDVLRAPGSVVIVRHSYAPGAFDPPDSKLEDCTTQRNLDDKGRAQARKIGEAFRANGILVGAVRSSPRCRCLDTARLAFGKAEPWLVLQGALRNEDLRRRQIAEIQKAIDAHRDGPPLVLVTHGSVVSDLTGLNVAMGAFVVLRRNAEGQHTVVSQLFVD
jgi:broad specificity phosphatase PhoE